jgi:hypothetical protein
MTDAEHCRSCDAGILDGHTCARPTPLRQAEEMRRHAAYGTSDARPPGVRFRPDPVYVAQEVHGEVDFDDERLNEARRVVEGAWRQAANVAGAAPDAEVAWREPERTTPEQYLPTSHIEEAFDRAMGFFPDSMKTPEARGVDPEDERYAEAIYTASLVEVYGQPPWERLTEAVKASYRRQARRTRELLGERPE